MVVGANSCLVSQEQFGSALLLIFDIRKRTQGLGNSTIGIRAETSSK